MKYQLKRDRRSPKKGVQRSSRHRSKQLFEQLADTDDRPTRARLRNELVERHLRLATEVAGGFRDRGETLEDVEQVARVGLIQAVDRFDPHRGVEFTTFAVPTIMGAVKRHFRDTRWAVRVPRSLQELHLAVAPAADELAQQKGRAPTVAELAKHLGISQEEVIEGLDVTGARTATSLDEPLDNDDEDSSTSLGHVLGDEDEGFEGVENQQSLRPLIAGLSRREKRILFWRFYDGLTQQQIGDRLGISQMHVSRILGRTLGRLRQGLLTDEAA